MFQKMKIKVFSLFIFVLRFKDGTAPPSICVNVVPDSTWPLGRGITNREIVTNYQPENRGTFTFRSGPTPLSYEGLHFYGNSSSYVDIRLTGLDSDFSLYFYINPTVHGGCILHYLSDSKTDVGITEVRLDMEANGSLTYSVNGNGLLLAANGSDTGTFVVPTNEWSIIIMAFDVNRNAVSITSDDWNSKMKENVLQQGTNYVYPGIMRIASTQDGNGSSFQGGLTCLHKIPVKKACVHQYYEIACTDNWPSTTSPSTVTSATTSSTAPSTTSTTTPTTTSTTTFTTTPATTSTTTLTTTSTTTPTTSSTTTLTTTSTTTPTTSSTTTPTTTSTTAPTTSSNTTPTTTSITTTTTASTTRLTSTSSAVSQTTRTTHTVPVPSTTHTASVNNLVLSPCLREGPVIQTGTRQYSLFNFSAIYANVNDVINKKIVQDIRECLWECNRLADCMTFSFERIPGRCSTGINTPVLKFHSDSVMFEVV